MAQTQSATVEGWVEMAKLLKGDAASVAKSIHLIGADFTANTAVTLAGLTIISGNGLDKADGTVTLETTAETGDTVQVTHQHTASGADDIFGFAVGNDDDDVAYMSCKYNATLSVESGDKVTNTGKIQFKAGAA